MDELGHRHRRPHAAGRVVVRRPDRDLARAIVKTQNEGHGRGCRDVSRSVRRDGVVPLQFPDIAAEMLEDGVKRLGLKGAAISAGFAARQGCSGPEYDVFWAKAQELGVLLFMHPGGGHTAPKRTSRGKGTSATRSATARDDDLSSRI
jgi:aminocarboxymuconate-semialdehyde decarboxylase